MTDIPTSGTNAIASNTWYHVAVTYNGADNTASNLLFYWTRLDTNRAAASVIGAGRMTNDLSAGECDFTLGNEGRATIGSRASASTLISDA